jgi:predicted RNA-binding protein with RPS1 domain
MSDLPARDEFGRLRKNGEGHHDNGNHDDRQDNNGRRRGEDFHDDRRYDRRHRRDDDDQNHHHHEDRRDHGRHGYDDRGDNRRHGQGQEEAGRDNRQADGIYGPATHVEEDLSAGLVVKGKVSRIEPYGAFLDFVEPKHNRSHRGLVHISQLAPHRVEQVSDVLQTQQEVHAVILEVEQGQRRIRLSLKDVDQETGKYGGPDLRGGGGNKGRPPPPQELSRRAQQRRDMYMDFFVDWREGSNDWKKSAAPGYLRTLWSPSPEPPSASAAPAKKAPPSKKKDDRSVSSEDDSSSSDSSSESSSDDRRRKRGRKRSSRDRKSKDRRRKKDSRSRRRRKRSSSSDESSSSSESSGSASSSSEKSRDAKIPKPDTPKEPEAAKEEWKEAEWKEAQDLKQAVQGKEGSYDDDEEFGPMPLPQSNAAGGTDAAGNGAYGGALLPGEGQAIAQYVQQNLRIPRRGEIGYDGDDIEQFEKTGYVMSGSRHARMNAVRIRKENQVYSAEEQRALALITMEENQQKEAQLMEDFRTMLKEKQKLREKGS